MSATTHLQNVDDEETSGPAEGRNVRDLAGGKLAPVGRRTPAPRDHPAADNADPEPAAEGGETRRAGDHAPTRVAPWRREQPDNRRPGLLTRVVSALGTWLVSSAGELEERALEQSLRDAVANSRMNVVTVAGQRGGVGKTSLAVCVGGLLADVARLNVVALDADLDYGPLADHVPDANRSRKTIVDLLNDFAGDQAVALPRLRPYLSRMPSGLLVLAAPDRREEMRELTTSDLDRALALLANFDLCFLDCAAGVERDLAPWATSRADRLIIVTTSEYVGARNVGRAISELPLEQAILAINKIPTGAGRRDHAVERELFSELLDQRFLVGYDEQLHRMLDQGRLDLARLRRATRLDLRQLAAAIRTGTPMRAALEHPRIASAIAAALILLALAAAAAGSALRGTEQRDAANSATVRLADARTTGLERQVHAAEVQNAQLRGALRTLQARADRLPRPQRCHSRLTPTTHSKR